jgi:ABC-2 type transport system permease protein
VISRLRQLRDVYAAKLRAEIAIQFAYRGAILIWLIGLVLQPVVYLVVWTTVAASTGAGGVAGYRAADFAAYFAILMVVNQLTFTWHFGFFQWRVQHGYFSPLLLRPVHPIHNDVAENLTFKLLTLTVVLPTAVLLLVAFDAAFAPSPWQVLAFVPALLLAMTLRFIVEWTLALAAFWVTRVMAINDAYFVLTLFLSGQIAPLDLLPGPVQAVATALPFRWMVAFPVELLIGRLQPQDALVGLAVQAAWIGVGAIVLRAVWNAGIRRYSAVGA